MSLGVICSAKPPRESRARTHDDVVGSEGELAAAITAAQHGDEDAFRLLYRAIQPGLLRYLRVQVGEAAEDVASEAWLQIARDLRTFRGDTAGFRGWAVTIARHRGLDHVRHQHRQPPTNPLAEELAQLQARDDTAGSALDAMATDAALALIARLPPDQGEAVLLRVVVGLDAKTAAKVLGKRAGAVRTAAYRGLRTLAVYLDEAGGACAVAAGVTQMPDVALKDMRWTLKDTRASAVTPESCCSATGHQALTSWLACWRPRPHRRTIASSLARRRPRRPSGRRPISATFLCHGDDQ
jgi:RNA polymerase sigma-70 factor (ECF subfamily)